MQKDFESAKARIKQRITVKPETITKPEPETAAALLKSSRARGGRGKIKEKANDLPRKDDNWWEAAAMFEFMQKAVNQGAMRVGHVTIERLAKLMVKRYEIEDTWIATNVILVHASNLCYMMDHPRRKNIQFFAQEPIYEELSADRNLSAADIRRAQCIELKPRKDHATLKTEASEESDSSSSAATPPQRRHRSKKGRLSVLRPKSSKYSGKGKSIKKGKGKKPDTDSSSSTSSAQASEEDSDAMISTPTQALSRENENI